MKVNGTLDISILVLMLASLASAEIYKWVDKNGKIHYEDRPPVSKEARPLKIDLETYSTVEIRPLDVGVESQINSVRPGQKSVVMYSTAWCGVCKKAKQYFSTNNIPFQEYDVEKSGKGKRDYKKLKAKGVPVILVGKQRMNGFSAASFEKMYYN